MYIKKIKLNNIRECFQDKEIEFEPGITAIVGPNGSGKSTLLQCISFCLSGQISSKQSDFLTYEKASISLITSDDLVIDRVSNGKTFSISVQENGETISARGTVNNLEWILSRYGWDGYSFINSVYLRQSASLDLLARPYEARNFLITLLNLKNWEDYYKKARELTNEKQIEILSLEKEIEAEKRIISSLREFDSSSITPQELQRINNKLGELETRTTIIIDSLIQKDETYWKEQQKVTSVFPKLQTKIYNEQSKLKTMTDGNCPTCHREYIVDETELEYQNQLVLSLEFKKLKLEEKLRELHLLKQDNLSKKSNLETIKAKSLTDLERIKLKLEEGLRISDRITEDVDKHNQVIKEHLAKVSPLEQDVKEYNLLSEAYSSTSGIPKLIFDESLITIAEYINKELKILSDELLEIHFITHTEKKETLDVGVMCNGSPRKDSDSVSGGQNKRIKIATLIGLAEYCGAGHLMMLDEPTDALDDGGRLSFMTLLRSKLNRFDQILLATHDTRLIDMCDHIVKLG